MIRRVASAALGVALALAGAEVAFRIGGLRPPNPDVDDTGTVYYNRHEHGRFHDYPWHVEKPAGVWRVVALGDSFAMGRRVPTDELYLKRVERALNERATGGRAYQIYNLARSGWNTKHELDALRLTGLNYDPDAVLVTFFVNDATGLNSNPEVIERMHEGIYQRTGWWNGVSRAYDYVDYLLRKQRVSRTTIASYRASFFDPDAQKTWAECQAALAQMRALADEHGFGLGLVIFPMLVQLDESHELAEVYEVVEEYCASIAIPTLNLLPAFLGQDGPSLWVAPTNAHPNSAANAIAAGPIEEFLVREGLVPRPEDGL